MLIYIKMYLDIRKFTSGNNLHSKAVEKSVKDA